MVLSGSAVSQHERLTIDTIDCTAYATLAADVRNGLSVRPKWLPPRYFYDERGSWLFERICETPEYYPTRVERRLLETIAGEIFELTQADSIVELGSGSSAKTEILLQEAFAQGVLQRYVPIDVCEEALVESGTRLLDRFSELEVNALVGDYFDGLRNVPMTGRHRLFVFLGGSIGNFSKSEAVACISQIAAAMSPTDWFLLGADRVKDKTILDAAYNDAGGYTAQFNLNVLNVINRELQADFNLNGFAHDAFYNSEKSQIEMHLRAIAPQSVEIGAMDMRVRFDKSESILTEISRKFTRSSLATLISDGNMVLRRHYEAENGYFSLVLAQRR